MAKTIKYQAVSKLKDSEFKRVTGVSKDTFALMKEVVVKYYRCNRSKGGRKKSLVPSDQILMMLEYYRQYRTYKEISIDYRVSESNTYYTIKKIEEILLSDNRFHLPSLKKTRQKEEYSIDVIVVDVTESPCERPKKSKSTITQAKRKDIL